MECSESRSEFDSCRRTSAWQASNGTAASLLVGIWRQPLVHHHNLALQPWGQRGAVGEQSAGERTMWPQ